MCTRKLLIHRKCDLQDHCLLHVCTPLRNHICTRERRGIATGLRIGPLGRVPDRKRYFTGRMFCGSYCKANVCRKLCPATGQIRQYRRTGFSRCFGTVRSRKGRATGAGDNVPVRTSRTPRGLFLGARAKWPPDRRRMDQADCIGLVLWQQSRGPMRCGDVSPRTLPRRTDPGSCRSRVHEPHGSWGVGRVFAGHTA
jgi:hypothetical protein